MKNLKLLLCSIRAAIEAGDAIMEIYDTDFSVDYKADNSPLTQADKRAHDIISQHLKEFNIPILSEEGRSIPYEQRKAWDQLWIVDPLDGTKEFVKRNGEFTVNIALVENHTPVLGVVFAPERKKLYFAMQSLGAFKTDDPQTIREIHRDITDNSYTTDHLLQQALKLPVDDGSDMPYTIVGSRSHATEALDEFVTEKRKQHPAVEFIPAGSSLKLCLVAEGKAHIYPRLAPTMEWDTAAGHAVVACAGSRIYQHPSGTPLVYNKENLLNPWFVVER